MAQLGGSIIYEPINRPPLPPVKIQRPPSLLDEFDRQARQKLELEILREQKRALEQQNNNTQNSSETYIFKLENINALTSDFELTEWVILSKPYYASFDAKNVKLIKGTQTKTYDISDSNDGDNFVELETHQGVKIAIKPLEKGLFMIIFLEKNAGFAYVGTLDNSQ